MSDFFLNEKFPVLEIKNLCVQIFKEKKNALAAENVFLKISAGEIAALVGESGSGKTLTALSVAGALPFSASAVKGEIFFEGKNILNSSSSQRQKIAGKKIAMVFQDAAAALDPLFTIGKQIQETAQAAGVPKKIAMEKSRRVLQKCGIPKNCVERVLNSFPHELSGGQKQRALIAMALVNSPNLLIADEPTSALDATLKYDFLKILLKFARENSSALLLITHDILLSKEIASHVFVMYAGRIVEGGRAVDIFENPFHPYTKALLRAADYTLQNDSKLWTLTGFVPSPFERKKNCCRFFDRCPIACQQCSKKAPSFFFSEDGSHFAECDFCKDESFA